MGNDLCLTDPDSLFREMEIKDKNMIVKYSKSKLRYEKSSISKIKQPLFNGHTKIYSAVPQKRLLYEGEMRDSKFNGFGKLYNKEGNVIYEGEFKDGLFEGWGITEKYTGQFREGKYDGFGIYMEFHDAKKDMVKFYYEGHFFDGLYNGFGIEIKDVNIPAQKIQMIHNDSGMMDYLYMSIQNGNTIASKYGAQQVYIGQFAFGYRHGVGRLFKDNREYSGQFSGGNYEVKGTVIEVKEEKHREQILQTSKSKKGSSCFKAF